MTPLSEDLRFSIFGYVVDAVYMVTNRRPDYTFTRDELKTEFWALMHGVELPPDGMELVIQEYEQSVTALTEERPSGRLRLNGIGPCGLSCCMTGDGCCQCTAETPFPDDEP